MSKFSRRDFIDKYMLPPGIEDRTLITCLRTYADSLLPATIATGMIGTFLYWLGSPGSGYFLWSGSAVSVLCAVLLKMGYHSFSRYLFITSTQVVLAGTSQTAGFQTFVWIYIISNVPPTFFMTTPRETNFRNYVFAISAALLALTLGLYGFGTFEPELGNEHLTAVRLISVFNALYGSGLLFICVLRYQQEVKEYKALLENQSLTMVQHAKMSSLGEMAAGVAHEINNPLGVIIGKIEVLEKRIAQDKLEPEKLVSDFGKIKVVVVRIAKIVAALRAFSRNADNDPFQVCNIDNILEDTLNFCSENLKNHNIEIRITGDSGMSLECRPTQICQILVNMINNSYDAIKELPEKWIELRVDKLPDQRVAISVTDSGKGIPDAIADKLMLPFFTTKDIGKGTGLGLSVAKGIVEDHGGKISLDQASKNTRFLMEFPTQQNRVGQNGPTTSIAAIAH